MSCRGLVSIWYDLGPIYGVRPSFVDFWVLKLVKQGIQISSAVIDMMDLKHTSGDAVKDEVVGETGNGD